MKRWTGPLITGLIVAGVALILMANLDLGSGPSPPVLPPKPADAPAAAKGALREYPIGDEVEKNGMRINAVWLPSVAMNGEPVGASDVIHIEADVKATEGSPHGFALGEFVPYLKIAYAIAPAGGGGASQSGELVPMVASDGLHYGASVSMPRAGEFRLTYKIQPPSAGGLGRHTDPVGGVAPWWEPFEAAFDWDYPGPPSGASK